MTLREESEHLLTELTRQRSSRWWLALAGVLFTHVAVAVGLAYQAPQPLEQPAGAPMVVEIANIAAAPATAASEAAPAQPTPEEQTPPPVEEPAPAPEPRPEPEPELALPEPEPTPEPEPAPEPEVAEPTPEPDTQPQETPAPQSVATPSAEQIASATTAVEESLQNSQRVSNHRVSWEGQLASHLERHKRYPYMARNRREEGVALLRFILDRDGRVLEAELDESSGSFLLDKEVKAMLKRAQPLPPPPPELAGNTVELVLPIEFALR